MLTAIDWSSISLSREMTMVCSFRFKLKSLTISHDFEKAAFEKLDETADLQKLAAYAFEDVVSIYKRLNPYDFASLPR